MKTFTLDTIHITDRHSAENTAIHIKEILSSFEIDHIKEDYMSFTTDEASNMMKTIREILDKRSLKCFAHMLNTIMKNSFKCDPK